MPVSPVPVVFPAILILVAALLFLKSARAGRNASLVAAGIVLVILLRSFVPGSVLFVRAALGSLPAQYEFARWRENHSEQIGELVIWPFSPDVLGGYASLVKAANAGYPPAVFALGVRLKYGDHVPRPENWTGAGGNHFPQPERGQALIDQAIEAGYKPKTAEARFYWQEYRKR